MMVTMVEPLLLKMLTNFGSTALWSTHFLLQRASCEHTVCIFGISTFACVYQLSGRKHAERSHRIPEHVDTYMQICSVKTWEADKQSRGCATCMSVWSCLAC